ncbi:MAG: aldehyde dehydrogenase family protein, partial [Acetatifactor sp.]|nr:aldehyde dehydrogenase family protein [Acetatifactor sp.]
MGQRAAATKALLNQLTTEEKNRALLRAADALCGRCEEILAANRKDMEAAQKNGMKEGLQDRLKLTEDRIRAMAEGLQQVAELPDCIGEVLEEFDRPNGMHLKKVRVPMGVIGIIYEARPNVTADAFGLCFKTGNAVILKGGSDAIHSNLANVKVLREALEESGIPADVLQLIGDTD